MPLFLSARIFFLPQFMWSKRDWTLLSITHNMGNDCPHPIRTGITCQPPWLLHIIMHQDCAVQQHHSHTSLQSHCQGTSCGKVDLHVLQLQMANYVPQYSLYRAPQLLSLDLVIFLLQNRMSVMCIFWGLCILLMCCPAHVSFYISLPSIFNREAWFAYLQYPITFVKKNVCIDLWFNLVTLKIAFESANVGKLYFKN